MTTKTRKPYNGPTADEKIIDALCAALKAGVNPWRREWLKGSSDFRHRNLLTGHKYCGGNPAMLDMWCALRGYDRPLWLAAGQARRNKWFPKKGSMGCYILRPQLNKRSVLDDNGKPLHDDNGDAMVAAWVSYKPVCVFNVVDMQGDGLADAVDAEMQIPNSLTEPERLQIAEATFNSWQVETKFRGDAAFYAPAADVINMPERKLFESSAGLYATWAHEIAHSTGHKSRLNRNMAGSKGSAQYAREELVAEIGAALICNRLGICGSVENHASYIDAWLQLLQDDGSKALYKAISDATHAANLVLGPDVVVTDSDDE